MRLRTSTVVTALVASLCCVVMPLGACGTNSSGSSTGGSPPNCAPSRATCANDSDCCSGSCSAGQCTCLSFAAPCHGDADCCEDLACDQNDRCSFGCRSDGTSCTTSGAACCSGACVGGICGPPRCIASGGSCDSSGDCCDGLGCSIDAAGHGTCESGCASPLQACGANGAAPFCCSGTGCEGVLCLVTCRGTDLSCTSNNQCCDSFACVGGKCVSCAGSGGTCANSSDCCAGTCQHKQCSCQAKGGSCASDADCCARLHCTGGSCACQDTAAACTSDDDCCDGLVCHQGHCGALACFDTGLTVPQMQACGGCCSGMCGSDRQTCCAQTGWSCDAQHGCCATDFCNASGACQACLPNGPAAASCTGDPQCCSGHCESGMCCTGSYSPSGGVGSVPDAGGAPVACGTDFCCAGLQCCADGYPPRCTQKNGTTCTNDADCCQVGADGGGTNGGCHNGTCCFTASPYTRCVEDSDCCAPAHCAAQNGKGPQICCWPSGMTCTDYMCGNCCTPPTIPPVGQTATCL